MKMYLSRGKATVVRGGLIGSLVSLVGNSVIADQPDLDDRVLYSPDDPIVEDAQDESRPILELDPERSYASEALLSFRSKIAPYGKLIGIRRTSVVEFRDVQSWKDVEEFVLGIDDAQIIAKVREPWGTEVVVTVTVNRGKFPSKSRPVEEPPTVPKPAESAPVPSKPNPATSVPATTETVKPLPGPTVSVERVPLEASAPMPNPTVSMPSKGATFSTTPLMPSGLAIDPPEPGTGPEVSIRTQRVLETSEPETGAPTSSSKKPSFAPQALSPTALAMTPNDPMRTGTPKSEMFASTALLALVPTMPIPAGLEKLAQSGVSFSYVKVVSRGTAPAVRVKPTLIEDTTPDQENWLREAVEMADRLGILNAKPLVTSDRRQNAFALYSLFMALKDLRFEMDLTTRQIQEAMDGGQSPQRLAQMSRSVEKGMASIMQWDVARMRREIEGYSAELNSIGDVRRMISFLASLKTSPKNGVRVSSD